MAKRRTPVVFEKLVGKLVMKVEAPYSFRYEDDQAQYLLLTFVDGTHASVHDADGGGVFISWGPE